MFALFKNGRITRISEAANSGDVKIELPDDFDFDHIDRYELVDGKLVKHDLPETENPSPESTVWDEMAAAYREGVQDA